MKKLSLFLLASAAVTLAVASTAPPPPPATKVPPRPMPRKSLGAPVINDVTTAYQYRTQIKMDPACNRFATEADNAFLSSTLDDAKKAAVITEVGVKAGAAGCLLSK